MPDHHEHYEGDGCGHEHIDVTPIDHDTDTHGPVLVAGAPLAEVGQIAVLRLQPDDRIAVTTPRPISDQSAVRLRVGIANWAGIDRERVVILDDGIDLTVLRPEENPDA